MPGLTLSSFSLPRSCRSTAVLVALVLLFSTLSLAGPPLICPAIVLDESEREQLALLGDQEVSNEVAVRELVALLDASDSGRFHVEALRQFFHTRRNALQSLIGVLEPRAEGAQGVAGADLPLARILDDWSGEHALESLDALARAADATADPALLLTVTEAIDLVVLESSVRRPLRHLMQRLSLHYFERALDGLEATAGASRPALERLFEAHLPYVLAMHQRQAMWKEIEPRVQALVAKSKRSR